MDESARLSKVEQALMQLRAKTNAQELAIVFLSGIARSGGRLDFNDALNTFETSMIGALNAPVESKLTAAETDQLTAETEKAFRKVCMSMRSVDFST